MRYLLMIVLALVPAALPAGERHSTLPPVQLLAPELDPTDDAGVSPTFYNPQLSSEMPGDRDNPLPESPALPDPISFDPGEQPDPELTPPAAAPAPSPAASRRLFHNTGVSWTSVGPGSEFAISDFEARTALVIPIFLGGPPPQIVGSFTSHFLDGPADFVSLPSRLYSVQTEFRWLRPVNDWLAIEGAVGPGWYSDFEGSDTGFRVTGRALALMTHSEQLKSAVGFVYLGRENLIAVPAVGLIWSPRAETRVEVLIPRPRVVQRIRQSAAGETWVYGGFELFGGNTWAVSLPEGSDQFSYTDWRIVAGVECKWTSGLTGRIEGGYVFARKLEFETRADTLRPGNTGFVRAGLTY